VGGHQLAARLLELGQGGVAVPEMDLRKLPIRDARAEANEALPALVGRPVESRRTSGCTVEDPGEPDSFVAHDDAPFDTEAVECGVRKTLLDQLTESRPALRGNGGAASRLMEKKRKA